MKFIPEKDIQWVSHPDGVRRCYYLHRLWGNDLAYGTFLPSDRTWLFHVFTTEGVEGAMKIFKTLKEGKAWAESYLRLQGVRL